MSDEKKESLDFALSQIGAKKVGHPIPVRTDNENPFKHLGGKCVLKPSDHPLFNADNENPFEHLGGKCVLKPSDHPLFNAKPEESVEKEGDARE